MNTRRLLPAALAVALVGAGCSSGAPGRAVPAPGSTGTAPTLEADDYAAVLPDLQAVDPAIVPVEDLADAQTTVLQFFTGDPGTGGLRYSPPTCAGAANPFHDAGSTAAAIGVADDAVYFVVVGEPGVDPATLRTQLVTCATSTLTTTSGKGGGTLTYDAGSDLVVPDVGQVPLARAVLTSPSGEDFHYTFVVAQARDASVLVGLTTDLGVTDDELTLVQTLVGITLTNIAGR